MHGGILALLCRFINCVLCALCPSNNLCEEKENDVVFIILVILLHTHKNARYADMNTSLIG